MANVLAHTFSLLSLRPGTFSGVMPALAEILKINVKEESDLDEVIDKLCFAVRYPCLFSIYMQYYSYYAYSCNDLLYLLYYVVYD